MFCAESAALGILPTSVKYRSDKRQAFSIPLFFASLFVTTGDKRAKASFERRLCQLAIDLAGFNVNLRARVSKDEAVCAQLQPQTVSTGDLVKRAAAVSGWPA